MFVAIFFHFSSVTVTAKLNMGLQQRQGKQVSSSQPQISLKWLCNSQGVWLHGLALVGSTNGGNSDKSSFPLKKPLCLGESKFSSGGKLSQDLGSQTGLVA